MVADVTGNLARLSDSVILDIGEFQFELLVQQDQHGRSG